jgi:hypothetical protein
MRDASESEGMQQNKIRNLFFNLLKILRPLKSVYTLGKKLKCTNANV